MHVLCLHGPWCFVDSPASGDVHHEYEASPGPGAQWCSSQQWESPQWDDYDIL